MSGMLKCKSPNPNTWSESLRPAAALFLAVCLITSGCAQPEFEADGKKKGSIPPAEQPEQEASASTERHDMDQSDEEKQNLRDPLESFGNPQGDDLVNEDKEQHAQGEPASEPFPSPEPLPQNEQPIVTQTQPAPAPAPEPEPEEKKGGGSNLWAYIAGGAAVTALTVYLLSNKGGGGGELPSACGGPSSMQIQMEDGSMKLVDFGWASKAHVETTYNAAGRNGEVWIDSDHGDALLSNGSTKVDQSRISYARGVKELNGLRVNSARSTYTNLHSGFVEFWSGGFKYFDREAQSVGGPENMRYGSLKSCFGRLIGKSGVMDRWIIAEWHRL